MAQQSRELLGEKFFKWVDDERIPDEVIRTYFIQAVKSGVESKAIDKAFHYVKAKRKKLKLHQPDKDEFNPFDSFYELLFFQLTRLLTMN